MNHTPGPWTAIDFVIEADSPDRPGFTDVVGWANNDVDESTALANARLMAAAPELLEAVKAASIQRDPRHRVSMLVNDWQRIKVAIAIAEGDL